MAARAEDGRRKGEGNATTEAQRHGGMDCNPASRLSAAVPVRWSLAGAAAGRPHRLAGMPASLVLTSFGRSPGSVPGRSAPSGVRLFLSVVRSSSHEPTQGSTERYAG